MKLSTTIMALGSLAALVASAPINTDEAAAALDVADASNVDIATDSTSSHNTGSIEHDPEHNWCYAHKTMTYLRFHVAGQHWNGVNITEADFRSTVDHCGLVTEFEFWPDEKGSGSFHATFRTPIRKKQCVTDHLQDDLGAPAIVHCTSNKAKEGE